MEGDKQTFTNKIHIKLLKLKEKPFRLEQSTKYLLFGTKSMLEYIVPSKNIIAIK